MDLIERHADAVDEGIRHPWEVARARTLLRLLARLGVDHHTERWLDVGAGDAWFARQLLEVIPPAAEVVCWDTGYGDSDLGAALEDGGRIAKTVEAPEGRFTGLLMLDVIEHVEEDVTFVRGVTGDSMDDEGWLLVTVPAHQWLFSDHDRALKHYRRYSPRLLHSVLRAAGLEVEAHGSLFHSLVPARGAAVLKERLVGRGGPKDRDFGVGHWDRGRLLTQLVTGTLEMEGRLSVGLGVHHRPTPPGLSNWAFCRRRPGTGGTR